MRRCLLLAAFLLAASLAPALGTAAPASGETTRVDLTFTLNPDDGTIDVRFAVDDPGSLATVQLALGRLSSLEGEATLEGDWKREDGVAVADLEASPTPTATWTADARIRVQSLEGEGHTSYVDDDFAVVKAGDVMPAVRYTFPQGKTPGFSTRFSVQTPNGWSVAGPWNATSGSSFRIDGLIPRGFLAADDELATGALGDHTVSYRIARVGGAATHETMEEILLEAGRFLPGLYGPTKHQRFVVIAPDPMFRGGLGSPDGIFLHADADGSVIAHEMAHAFQGWQFSRDAGKATIWLAEGAAVVHGTLLEVATGLTSRQEALEHLRDQAQTAREEHAVDLTTAVYGSGNEQAAYTKGAVVVTALDDAIRNATSNEYTLADVLKRVNERSQASPSGQLTLTTPELVETIANVTRYDLTEFFDLYVYGSDVPLLGSVFPGQAAVRLLGTDPDPPVAEQPLAVRVQLTNLDTDRLSLELPVLVNGTEAGTLRATLAAGGSAIARVNVTPLPRGAYTVGVQDSQIELRVLGPPDPVVEATVWPRDPVAGENVTVGARVANHGASPYRGPVTLTVDGRTVTTQAAPVAAGDTRTLARTLAPLAPGEHTVQAVAENGTTLDEQQFVVTEPTPTNQAPGVEVAILVTLLAAASGLARGRRRT